MARQTQDAKPESILIRASEVAVMLSISVRHVWALVAREKLPSPIRLGNSTRWRRSDIEQWLAHSDCPGRKDQDRGLGVRASRPLGGA